MRMVSACLCALSTTNMFFEFYGDNSYLNEMLCIDVRPRSVAAWPRIRLHREKAARAHAHRGKSLPCINVVLTWSAGPSAAQRCLL